MTNALCRQFSSAKAIHLYNEDSGMIDVIGKMFATRRSNNGKVSNNFFLPRTFPCHSGLTRAFFVTLLFREIRHECVQQLKSFSLA